MQDAGPITPSLFSCFFLSCLEPRFPCWESGGENHIAKLTGCLRGSGGIYSEHETILPTVKCERPEELLLPPSPPPKQETITFFKGLQEDDKTILVAHTTCDEAGGGEEGSVWVRDGPSWSDHICQPASAGSLQPPQNPTEHVLGL